MAAGIEGNHRPTAECGRPSARALGAQKGTHLHNAARALAAILNAKYPEHTFVVEVKDSDGADSLNRGAA